MNLQYLCVKKEAQRVDLDRKLNHSLRSKALLISDKDMMSNPPSLIGREMLVHLVQCIFLVSTEEPQKNLAIKVSMALKMEIGG